MPKKTVSNQEYFKELVKARMPFGKYANRLLIDLPESYILWFKEKGFPKGELGKMLQIVYEIKLNGLEYLIKAVGSRPRMVSSKPRQRGSIELD
ncbi:MAG: DUF3820 family protein [Elusimicrobia bacterium]|nr:DUF3820 family protein [Elusimicrobiota bacterium]